MRTTSTATALIAGVVLGCAGNTTQILNPWKDPNAQPLMVKAGDTVVAMVISRNESTRRSGETALAAELERHGVKAVPSYTIVPTDEVRNQEASLAKIRETGAAAVVVMRPVRTSQETSYVPPAYTGPPPPYLGGPYGRWGPYYGYGWGAAYSPGYYVTDEVVQIEILVFDLRQDKLIWAGLSQTTNPPALDEFMRNLVNAAGAEMAKEGVIAPLKTAG
jgi:hypothetical protein